MAEPPTLRDLPELLHDATLERGAWRADRSELALWFTCLRRSPDGADLDPAVELRLTGVAAVAVTYDPVWPEVRPSALVVDRDLAIAALEPWPLPAAEAAVGIDSPAAAEDLELAARTDWLVGGAAAEASARHRLSFAPGGGGAIARVVTVACDGIEPWAGGAPLPLARWADEYAAWWQGWRDHWSSDDGDDDEEAEEGGDQDDEEDEDELDTADWDRPEPADMLAAGAAPAVGLDYRPPAELPFDLEPTDAPTELLRPIQDWFESFHALDWSRRAQAFPDLDVSLADRALQLEHSYPDEHGVWDYARAVTAWWREGRRAYVRVQGVEHFMPMDGEAATDRLAHWSFELRRRGETWQIHRYLSGFDHGVELPEWAVRWRASPIRVDGGDDEE